MLLSCISINSILPITKQTGKLMKTLSPALQELEYYGVEDLLYWFEYPISYIQELEKELNTFYIDAEKIELNP